MSDSRRCGCRRVRLKTFDTGGNELCLTVLSGQVDVQLGRARYSALGSRASVFESQSPTALYVPPGSSVRFSARGAAEVGLSTAPAEGRHAARVIEPSQMQRSVRGSGGNLRHVCDILPETAPAERLLSAATVHVPCLP